MKIDFSDGPEEKQLIIFSVDIMHLMGIYFLVTVARDIRFITTMALWDQKKKTVSNALNMR